MQNLKTWTSCTGNSKKLGPPRCRGVRNRASSGACKSLYTHTHPLAWLVQEYLLSLSLSLTHTHPRAGSMQEYLLSLSLTHTHTSTCWVGAGVPTLTAGCAHRPPIGTACAPRVPCALSRVRVSYCLKGCSVKRSESGLTNEFDSISESQ